MQSMQKYLVYFSLACIPDPQHLLFAIFAHATPASSNLLALRCKQVTLLMGPWKTASTGWKGCSISHLIHRTFFFSKWALGGKWMIRRKSKKLKTAAKLVKCASPWDACVWHPSAALHVYVQACQWLGDTNITQTKTISKMTRSHSTCHFAKTVIWCCQNIRWNKADQSSQDHTELEFTYACKLYMIDRSILCFPINLRCSDASL